MATNWSLYLVTDPQQGGGPENVAPIVDKAIRGGVSVVQLRDKDATEAEFLARAIKLKELMEPTGVPLFVDDRLDVACELGLNLHIGQNDVDYLEARKKLPGNLMLGLSVGNHRELDEVERMDPALRPDVIGVGPVADTTTKKDAPAGIGVQAFAEIATRAKGLGVPAVAIGGVNLTNASELGGTDGAGICVVSAIMKAADPEEAARELRAAFENGRK